VLIREIRGFFNRLSRGFETKIRKIKKFLTAFVTSSCEHRESRIEHFFHTKRANSAQLWLGIISYRDDDEEGNNVWYWRRKRKEEDEYTRNVKSSLKQLNLPKLPNFD